MPLQRLPACAVGEPVRVIRLEDHSPTAAHLTSTVHHAGPAGKRAGTQEADAAAVSSDRRNYRQCQLQSVTILPGATAAKVTGTAAADAHPWRCWCCITCASCCRCWVLCCSTMRALPQGDKAHPPAPVDQLHVCVQYLQVTARDTTTVHIQVPSIQHRNLHA